MSFNYQGFATDAQNVVQNKIQVDLTFNSSYSFVYKIDFHLYWETTNSSFISNNIWDVGTYLVSTVDVSGASVDLNPHGYKTSTRESSGNTYYYLDLSLGTDGYTFDQFYETRSITYTFQRFDTTLFEYLMDSSFRVAFTLEVII